MKQLLKTYSISKTAKASFTLKFETTKNVVVVFDNDLKTIALSEGESSQTKYSQNYTSTNGKLTLKFRQNFGGAQPVVEDPKIDIYDTDL